MLALTNKIASGVCGSSVSRSERLQVVNKRGNIETVPHRDQMQRDMHNWIIKQRKVELHRHLEGAIPYETLHQFYQYQANHSAFRHMKPSYATVSELRQDVGLLTPMKDLAEVLDRLAAFQHAFVSIAATREITLASMLHAYREENIEQVEFRFSPEFMAEPAGLDWDKMFEAMLEAKSDCEALLGREKFRAGFIVIASRNYGLSSASKTIEFAERWKNHLVGFDLAASETAFETSEFVPAINRAHDLGLGITVHTGEGVPASYIDQVISLYRPHRLGHATSLITNPELMQKVIQANICVESCPTSNIITRCTPDYPSHPLIKYLRNGVPVTVNTDDPMLFGTDLNLEWLYVMDEMGATQQEMLQLNENARKHSFIKTDKL